MSGRSNSIAWSKDGTEHADADVSKAVCPFTRKAWRRGLLASTALGVVIVLFAAKGSALAVVLEDHEIDGTTETLDGGHTDTGGALTVGVTGTGVLYIIDDSTLNSTFGYLGYEAGASGSVTVNDATWDSSDELYVGYSGTGTLTVENEGSVSYEGGYLGNSANSVGTVTVTGTGSEFTGTVDLSVGYRGIGTLTVENGGTANYEYGYIGQASSGVGTVTVTGPGSALTSTDSSDGDLTVGYLGSGTLNVLDGATATNVEAHIADDADSTGTVTVDNATWTNTGSLYVANAGTGSLTIQNAGTVKYDDGYIGQASSGVGTVTVTGPGSALTSTDSSDGDLTVGYLGSGTLSILDGATATNVDAYIADETNSRGTVTVDNATWTNTGNLYVANAGKGSLTIQNGGSVSSLNGILAANDGSLATVTVDNATWTTNFFQVGGSGAASLTIQNGGSVSSNTGEIARMDGSSATARVDGGNWTISTTLDVGNDGIGTLMIKGGGTVSSNVANIGSDTNGRGTATVTGNGSSLSASGTMYLARSGIGTLIIADSGSVSVNSGNGTVTIANDTGSKGTLVIGAAAGSAAVTAGNLTASAITFGSGTGEIVFNHTNADYTFNELISGGGSVSVYSGETVLTAANTYTGATTIEGGTLTVNGSISGSTVTVNGGSIGGSGTIGDLGIASGGTLAPGNSIGTLNVTNLTINSGSTYTVEIEDGGFTAGTHNDLVAATNTVKINGGTVHVTSENGAFPAASYTAGTYTIVSAASGVSGTFSDVNDDFAFLSFALSYDANNVYLTSTIDGSCAGGFSSNQCAAGTGALSLGSGTLYNTVLGLSTSDAPTAMDLLSGEIHASVKTALLDESVYVRDAVNTRLRQAFGAFIADGGLATASDAGALFDQGATVWFKAYGGFGSSKADSNVAELSRQTGGLLAGVDGTLESGWVVGLLAGYSQSSLDVDARNSSAQVQTFHTGVYGAQQWGATGFRLGGEIGWHGLSTNRTVNFRGFSDSLEADYSAQTLQLFTEVAHDFRFDEFVISPFANLAYAYVHTDNFSETGGAAALTASSRDGGNGFQTIGLRIEREMVINEGKLAVGGMIGWRHVYGAQSGQARLAFAGGDDFNIDGAPLARDAFALQAGARMELTPSTSFGTSYSGLLGSGSQNHVLSADFDIRF